MSAEATTTSRFDVIRVTKKASIREIVEKHDLCFKKGKGYYQLTKPENIQHYKVIVARRQSDGQFMTGDKIREILKIPKDALKFRLDTSKLPDFKIFIQSTSYNRVLMPNTDFLYEIDDATPTHGKKRKVETTPITQPKIAKTLPPPPPFYGAGGPIEIVFSFDTTGSMSSCLNAVRANLQDLIQRLYTDIPTLRMAVFAHGDYCDRHNYVTKHIDFTTDVKALCNFVKNVASTGGGDYPEAYELVLHEVREKLSWSPGTQRALVMIGDAIPHTPDFPENTLNIDWKVEVDRLIREMGVRIYGVQCSNNSDSDKFFDHMATQTHGHHLQLDDFNNVQDFIMAICYREQGDEFLQAYHTEVVAREGKTGMNSELHQLFDTLKGPTSSVSPITPPGTPPASKIKCKPAETPVKLTSRKKILTKATVKRNLFKTAGVRKVKRSLRNVRVQREKISQGDKFVFKNLRWSPWKVAVTKKTPNLDDNWGSVSRNIVYNKTLFSKCSRYSALYEFAIKSPHQTSKSVIYLRAVKGFVRNENWYKHLLVSRSIQVRKAVRMGCTVFVRRVYAVPKTSETVAQCLKRMKSQFVKKYDYAWNTSEYKRKNIRGI